MNKERLAILSAALRAPLPESVSFNLMSWRQDGPCGTVCCAIGLATMLPELQAQGLEYRFDQPWFDDNRGWSAVINFFNLSIEEAHKLFNMYAHPFGTKSKPQDVADRIDALINGQ